MFIQESLESHVNNPHKVVDCTINGQCSQCGGCCSNTLPLTPQEIIAIKQYVKANNIQPSHAPGLLLRRECTYDNTCPFLDHTKSKEKCKIYEVRPHICRTFICSDKDLSRYVNDPKYLEEIRTPVAMREIFFPNK